MTDDVLPLSRWELGGAFVVGLFGTANTAQGVAFYGSDAFVRPLTALLLPLLSIFGISAIVRDPRRLTRLWPVALLVLLVFPTFFLPSYTNYLTVEATPVRVLALFCLPMLFAGLIIREKRQVHWLLSGVLSGAVVVALAVLLNPTRDIYNDALQAGDTDTISTGVSTALGCLILAYWASRRPRWFDPLAITFWLGALAFGYVTLLTQSRQAAVMLAVGLPMLLVALLPGNKRLWVGVPLGLLGIAFVAWFQFEVGRAAAGFNRWDLWWPVLGEIGEYPTGIGWGNYFAYAPSNLLEGVRYPHNLLLQAFLEGGWAFGLALVAALLLAADQFFAGRRLPEIVILGTVWLAVLISSNVSSDITGDRTLAVATGALLGLRATRVLSATRSENAAVTSSASALGRPRSRTRTAQSRVKRRGTRAAVLHGG